MSQTEAREHWLRTAHGVLRILSSPAEDQQRYLQRLGVAGSVDELALEFDDVWKVLRPLLNDTESDLRDRLEDLDHALSGDDLHWNTAALSQSPAWQRIRDLARRALEALDDDTER